MISILSYSVCSRCVNDRLGQQFYHQQLKHKIDFSLIVEPLLLSGTVVSGAVLFRGLSSFVLYSMKIVCLVNGYFPVRFWACQIFIEKVSEIGKKSF